VRFLALLIAVGALFPCYMLTAPPRTLLLHSPGPDLPRCILPARMAVLDPPHRGRWVGKLSPLLSYTAVRVVRVCAQPEDVVRRLNSKLNQSRTK
jgi:hypothetical protein